MGLRWDDIGQCYLAESSSDFRGWEFVDKEFWKEMNGENIYKVYIRTPFAYNKTLEFRTVFCNEKSLPKTKDNMCL